MPREPGRQRPSADAMSYRVVRGLAVLGAWVLLGHAAAFAAPSAASAPGPAPSGRPLVVVSDDDYPPYAFHRDGRVVGLVVDAWADWSRRTGVPVDLRPMAWASARQTMASGGADVIDTIFRTPEREKTLDFTGPWADLPVPVFAHRDLGGITAPADLRPFVVAVKAGDECETRLTAAGVRSIERFDSYTHIVEEAVAGRVRLFCMDGPPARYLLLQAGALDRFREAFVLYSGQFHRGVRKGDAATLALVERGFAAVPPDEARALRDKWLGTPLDGDGANAQRVGWEVVASLTLGTVALVALLWGLRLRRAVRRKAMESERGQRRLRTLIDTLPDPVWLKDPAGRFLGCNPRFSQLVGVPESKLLGVAEDALPPATGIPALAAADRAVLASRTPLERETVLPATEHRPTCILESQHTPVWDASGALLGVLGIARDVSQRRANERHLRRLNRLHEVLTAAHAALDAEREFEPLMTALCRLLVNQGGLRMAWVARPDFLHDQMVPVAWAGATGDYLDPPNGTISEGPMGDTPCAIALRSGAPAWSRDIPEDPAMAPWAEKAQALGYRSSSAFPFKSNGRVVAVLTVYSSMVEFFDEDELALLQRLSEDVGHALEGHERDLERAHAALALQESESRFATMFKTSPTGMALCRFADKAFLDVNAAFVDLLGYSPAELSRRHDGDAPIWVDTGLRDRVWDAIGHTGEVRDVEARMRARDGHVLEISFSASRIRVGSDDLMLATLHDLTAQRLAQRTLQDRQQELEELVRQRTAELSGILDAMPDLFFRMTRDGTLVDYRAGRRSDLLLPPEDFLGKRVADVMPPSAADPIMAAVARAIDGHRTEIVEYPLALRDGEHFFEARILPLSEDQLIAFVRNITDRKSLEADRERARQRAEELAEAKSEFLANMSHEIRTPLNGLLGLAQLGQRETRDAQVRHTFGAILDSGRLLLGIVDDVLDFSKLEVGKLRVESEPVSPRALAEDVVAMMRERAVAKDIALALEFAPGLPGRFLGDPLRIQQVLVNLLSNAIKFTERGGVTVSVALERDAPGVGGPANDDVVFRVVDTGVGIAQEHLQLLFQAFQQADTSTTRRFGGTGLGLAISRRLAELMGGEVRVRSTLGSGSTFELRLPAVSPDQPVPAQAAGGPAPAAAPGPSLQGMRVLVAEDNEVNQLVLERALKLEGAEVVLVPDGRQAVARIVEEGATAYDVVLMDIQMPEMDGHEATRRILEIAPRLPVIGQTAHAMMDERLECLASGMVDHIAKPIDFRKLTEVLLRHARPRVEAG